MVVFEAESPQAHAVPFPGKIVQLVAVVRAQRGLEHQLHSKILHDQEKSAFPCLSQ